MTHYACEGFGFPGGVGKEEYEHLFGDAPSEAHIFRVISRKSFLPLPEPLRYTQYSTCFAHNLDQYVSRGWTDEGYEAITEKACIDWINLKPDCSVEVLLNRDPGLQAKMRNTKQPNVDDRRAFEADMDAARRGGKYI